MQHLDRSTAPRLGILMLNTRFPRVPGDIGNPMTFDYAVRHAVIELATVDRIVTADGPSAEVMDAFVEAAHGLVEQGVEGLTTSCGFMAIAQRELAGRCRVPVISSSLCQIPLVQAALPAGKRVGVITIDSTQLTAAHFAGVGAPTDLPIEGVEAGDELARVIQEDLETLDVKKAEADVIDAGRRLLAKAPDVGAIVLECTNMAPYARTLARALDLPVYDIIGLLGWWRRSLEPPVFEKRTLGAEA
ncbi:MAG: aspartate/glutamate racemase family protein [Alphaproteobacteria bacterium]|nr:aspartate/glutamate racemase family protein [Alphaproteobacteria bacterium]